MSHAKNPEMNFCLLIFVLMQFSSLGAWPLGSRQISIQTCSLSIPAGILETGLRGGTVLSRCGNAKGRSGAWDPTRIGVGAPAGPVETQTARNPCNCRRVPFRLAGRRQEI
jgi:hypothetical protein